MNSYNFEKNQKALSTSKVKKPGISNFLRNSWMKGKQLLGLSDNDKRIPYRKHPEKGTPYNLQPSKTSSFGADTRNARKTRLP